MAERDVTKTVTTNLDTNQDNYSVSTDRLDGPQQQKETLWTSTTWTKNLGYYKKIPELKAAIDSRAKWIIGKGYTAEETTTIVLDAIKGWGKDTFCSIIENLLRCMFIDGNAYAEIIQDENKNLINLKPINPELMQHVINEQGMITEFRQLDRMDKKKWKTFKPHEIFYLSKDRLGDEIHGIGIIDALEENILAVNEAISDYKISLHRNVKPLRIVKADMDNQAQLEALALKYEEAIKKGEVIVVPANTQEMETQAVAQNATLNPMPWIEQRLQKFWQSCGTPEIITGNSSTFTEAAGKLVYLSFYQTIYQDQLFVEEQVLSQLNLEIEIYMPTSLMNDSFSQTNGEADAQALQAPEMQETENPIQNNDTEISMAGRT